MSTINTGFSSATHNIKDNLGSAIYDVYDMDKCIRDSIDSIRQIKFYKKTSVKNPDFSDFPDSLIQTAEELFATRQKRQELESENPLKKAKDFLTGKSKLKDTREEERKLVYQLKDDFLTYFSKIKHGILTYTHTDKKMFRLWEIHRNLYHIVDRCRKEDGAYPWEGGYIDAPCTLLQPPFDYKPVINANDIKNK